ncbi:hypothetical protein Hypma_001042 [Hypsizygus marmoreus]|uniref:Uncharacterized protein n=1 Tax=Hypsizygus marmoreus TaxID=39966 RepID=A0A369JD04_HYPMA|nr:hypothetical protein Hypma_001042 [Hypsizygus marmoreus]
MTVYSSHAVPYEQCRKIHCNTSFLIFTGMPFKLRSSYAPHYPASCWVTNQRRRKGNIHPEKRWMTVLLGTSDNEHPFKLDVNSTSSN